ncbi:hypothetical protein GIB67_037788 [Kingdonia uniflora]|uniref:NAC domain-containing protein n=1 Tax=Kingdonia uniflora TaxID=39325 RepID=A0A7J7LVA4_9MAGN|nr:hypothetical protein GIB67_037788 [Kingdonia uniflora]
MENMSVLRRGDEEVVDLPPGFRFHPTDEEIISFYLSPKVIDMSFTTTAIGEVDLNKSEPWDLPKKAKMGEKEWYFFCQRDRKYPTGMRTNRATDAGYWKATGKDKEIFKGRDCLVGMKKTLVFYRGRAPKGEKTNWVMHEYRLEGKFSYNNLPKSAKDEWVVCRVFHKNTGVKKSPISSSSSSDQLMRSNPFGGEDFLDSPSLPPLMEPPFYINTSNKPSSSYISNTNTYPTNQAPPNSIYYPPSAPLQNNLFSFQGSSHNSLQQVNNNSVLTYDQKSYYGMKPAECKVEQFSSNHSMISLSQDTGLSTDVNTEISSVFSGANDLRNDKFYLDQDIDDLDNLWNY